MTVPNRKWLSRPPVSNPVGRIFCLPYSGCGASMYRSWPAEIDGIEICPVQPPGRENRLREPAFDNYPDLAESLIEALLPLFDRPFAFFGHCASALVGYEVTVQLMKERLQLPTRLFVSSQVAPHKGPHGRFLTMSEPALAAELGKLVVELGGTPRPDMIELAMDTLRVDVEANRRYRLPAPIRLPVPITALAWTDDAEVPADLMGDWADCGQVDFHTLTGGHYGFIQAPAELTALLAAGMIGSPVR
jgi:surfactin synthase thioesterase subunit